MTLAIALIAGAAMLCGWIAILSVGRRFRRDLRSRASRARLWDTLYGWDWGSQATNNYGFAPAAGDEPERFQLQMYRELAAMAEGGRAWSRPMRLLEVSCGRGGGLASLVRQMAGKVEAIGLDLSESAIRAATELHADVAGLAFTTGSALDLPFPDARFDVVLNVEASHEYGDLPRFLAEVRRVLRRDGIFLHCDSRLAERAPALFDALQAAGFQGRTRDVTANVAEACRLDSARRARLLRRAVPLGARMLIGGWMRNYAALEGTRKYAHFRTGRRRYYLSCMTVPGDA